MSQWQILSEPFEALNGYKVTLIGDDESARIMGGKLNNGLSVHPQLFTRQCVRGEAQIAQVSDNAGAVVACSFLRVHQGKVEAEFVRGNGNDDLVAGEAFDAVANYIMSVNARTNSIKMLLGVGSSDFVDLPEEKLQAAPVQAAPVQAAPNTISVVVEDSLWNRAVRASKGLLISPFRAFLNMSREDENKNNAVAVVQPPAPVQEPVRRIPIEQEDDFEGATWQAVSEGYTASNGLVVEPMSSVYAVRKAGERLHNMLMAFPEQYGERCRSGALQLAVVYNDDRIVGFAEFQVGNGVLIPTAARGYAEGEVTREVSKAVQEYTGMVIARQINVHMNFGSNTFVTGYEPERVFSGQLNVHAAVPAGARSLAQLSQNVRGFAGFPGGQQAIGYDNDGYSRDEEERDEEELDEEEEMDEEEREENDPEDVKFSVLVPSFTASNNYTVVGVENELEMSELGGLLHNALGTQYIRQKWVDETLSGECQVLGVNNPQGEVVAAADIRVRDGQVYPFLVLGDNNAPVDAASDQAIRDWCQAVNAKTVDLMGTVTDSGFDLPEPEPAPATGMGM